MTTQKPTIKQKWQTLTFCNRTTIRLTITGLVISTAGFFMVVKSLRSSDSTASINTYLQTYGWTLDIDKIFIQNPELKRYLYSDSIKLKTDAGYLHVKDKVDATAEYILDNYDAILNNESYFKNNPTDGDLWMCTVSTRFHLSSILRTKYLEEEYLYSPKLNNAYQQRDSINRKPNPCCSIHY